MKKGPELLAPAGDLQGAVGAINAGADAVYLGAEEFSARAYAKNLSVEEIIEILHYAHLYHRKIYLTMNTLLKTVEWERAIAVLDKLYQAGLDAVIVQDLGLIRSLDHYFHKMEIHASTQLAVLSSAGMEWLKQFHVTRVVPGRELSLAELKEMKQTGLELECFIHGAMCYSYSGRCLMSSLAGGRSGNRGRCAGPCRKLYHQPGQEMAYLLSMKDMCSVDRMKQLMEAGIDSFKIEGRMKAAEYTAGVTSVYRRVIDRIQNGENCAVTEEDREILKELYIRSEVQEGYYFKHNGKEMISLKSPSYAGGSEELKQKINEQFLKNRMHRPISGTLRIRHGMPMELSIVMEKHQVTACGEIAQKAEKRALTDEELKKQICKTGNTFFEFAELQIDNDGMSFAAVSQLKELRRKAIALLEEEIFGVSGSLRLKSDQEEKNRKQVVKSERSSAILAGVKTEEQLRTVLKYPYVEGVILDLMLLEKPLLQKLSEYRKKWYVRLPEIIRQKDLMKIKNQLHRVLEDMAEMKLQGFYCSSLDALALAGECGSEFRLIADTGVYVLNEESEETILQHTDAYTASVELNKKELSHAIRKDARELIVYGYLPVMYSANCIMTTTKGCSKMKNTTQIMDENGRSFPVLMNHKYCYNTIYNCVPLSLHQYFSDLYQEREAAAFRLEFTMEDEKVTERIMNLYQSILGGEASGGIMQPDDEPVEFTKGHFNRGVQ
ncbi:MAG: U32 family peptidase [Lachnospiraceae bacterium]|nr:U32 family peptidase [Lachnospiraceae bacterium]